MAKITCSFPLFNNVLDTNCNIRVQSDRLQIDIYRSNMVIKPHQVIFNYPFACSNSQKSLKLGIPIRVHYINAFSLTHSLSFFLSELPCRGKPLTHWANKCGQLRQVYIKPTQSRVASYGGNYSGGSSCVMIDDDLIRRKALLCSQRFLRIRGIFFFSFPE